MSIHYEENTKGYLDISFSPIWDYISLTRHYIENFLLINLMSKSTISKITISVEELLENAVKYSKKDGVRLVLSKNSSINSITIDLYNFAKKKDCDELFKAIEMMNHSDSLQYYLEQMRKSVKRTDGKSCLGLARLNHETDAKISADYKEKDIIHVQAILNY